MRLHVEHSGAGPDLALIHGWGLHGGVWQGLREDLATNFTLHVVDLPGHGRSAMRQPYGLEDLAGDLLDSLPPRIFLCGWSLGAQVALRAAALEPRRVERLALAAATPCFARRPDWPWGMEREALEEFAAELGRDFEATLRRFLALQARGGDAAREVVAALRARLFERGPPDPQALRAGLALLAEGDLRPLLPRISQPVLLVHGERDLVASPGAARWMAGSLGNARLVMMPGCAHAPFLSQPAVFAGALHEFFSGSRNG
ncbi:MAG TPA: pimeloyl-ACP methyl ester esterase BioH [Burkholderiales bacterium]|nr:pimeloyl-ACP methyl ester esterase BioH [Burkholderiales bacterium]